jgi:hypothetical protein
MQPTPVPAHKRTTPADGPGSSGHEDARAVKRARRTAADTGDGPSSPTVPPCELEQHELRMGPHSITLHRRVPGLAPAPSSAVDTQHIRMIELDRGADTTGLDLWTPAVRLCVRYLQSSAGQQLLDSSSSSVLRVLELGAGLGAAGLLTAQSMGPRLASLCLTDGAECVLPLLQHNASLNPLSGGARVTTAQLRFGNDQDGAAALETSWPAAGGASPSDDSTPLLVLGCEVLYSRALALPLLRTLRQLLCQGGRGSTALLSHTVRRAIFAGPNGQLMREPTDSSLDIFLQAAAVAGELSAGDDGGGGEGTGWCACKLDVRMLQSTCGSEAATAAACSGDGSEKGEEVRLYSVCAVAE